MAVWWGLVVVITVVGFGLRVRGLDRLPLIIDEIGFAAKASDILHGQHVPIFAPGHNANPSVYSWLVAGAMEAWGQTRFAMRLIPLLFGTLSIPAAYLLGRVWFGRGTGVMAAAFLATYPVHIFYSRMSLYNIVDPFFVMLALVCLAKAANRGEQRYWMLAGVWAGIGQYFYHGSRLVIVLVVVYVALNLIQERNTRTQRHKDTKGEGERDSTQSSFEEALRRREGAKAQGGEESDSMQRSEGAKAQGDEKDTMYRVPTEAGNWASWWVNIGWMVVTFGVVSLPRFAPMLVGGLPVTGNMEGVRLPADFGANAVRAVLAWVGQPDVSLFWLSDGRFLEWAALIVAGVGIIVSLRRWQDERYGVLLVWVVLTTIFGGIIWSAAPLYVRYMTAVPAVALLVGVGVRAVSCQLLAVSYQRSAISKTIRRKGAKRQRRKGERETIQHRGAERQRDRGKIIAVVVVGIIVVQGVMAAWGQVEEAAGRVSESQWTEDALAWEARGLPEGVGVMLVGPEDFGMIQRVTIADYVAAYGQRRAVMVGHGRQAATGDGGYVILEAEAER